MVSSRKIPRTFASLVGGGGWLRRSQISHAPKNNQSSLLLSLSMDKECGYESLLFSFDHFQPFYQDVTTFPQRFLLIDRCPTTPCPPNLLVPIDQEHIPYVLVRHPQRFSEVLERLVRQEVGRVLLDWNGFAQRRDEHRDEERFEWVLLQVDLLDDEVSNKGSQGERLGGGPCVDSEERERERGLT